MFAGFERLQSMHIGQQASANMSLMAHGHDLTFHPQYCVIV